MTAGEAALRRRLKMRVPSGCVWPVRFCARGWTASSAKTAPASWRKTRMRVVPWGEGDGFVFWAPAHVLDGFVVQARTHVRLGSASAFSLSRSQQLHGEDQRGVRGDQAAGAAGAVAEVGGDDEGALFADFHGGYAFIPSLDDLALAEEELEGVVAIAGAVELLSVGEPAGVVDAHGLAGFRRV